MSTDVRGGSEVPLTFERGPSEPLAFADGVGTYAETVVAAPPSAVWPAVTDIDLPARFSDEFRGARWEGDGRGLGATFVGASENQHLGAWELRCHVDVFEEGRRFGWCTVDPSEPGASWRFDLEPDGGRTRLRFSVTLGPGPSGLTMAIGAVPDKEARIIERRIRDLHGNMRRTVEGIKAMVEGADGPPDRG